ncbi:protein THEM6 [Toxorhynchites rutilus septentrionalis]|uniref:protein THEM6 n=1 Tax=Toxorhynchites rutilus septentrionalis TaxID=329112 RepID=UPI0024796FE0|nr:protein THEM6 [Toxorhynchites rutilus septentrionalis]
MLCTVLAIVLGVIVALYALFELHYFLRMCLCLIAARYIKKRIHILETATVGGLCLTNDIDTLLYHMNNARYLREVDFARVDFYERTLLYRTIVSKGGSVVQGATTIRYRRFIRPFTRFSITSRIVYWDTQSIFMEHRFIGPSDGFIHCIALCRQRVIQCSVEDVMATLLKPIATATSSTECLEKLENGVVALGNGTEYATKLKPEMPHEVAKWLEWNEMSSANLRNEC